MNFLFKTSEKSGRLFFYDIWKWFQSNFYGLLLIIGVSIFAKQIIRLEILKDSLSDLEKSHQFLQEQNIEGASNLISKTKNNFLKPN